MNKSNTVSIRRARRANTGKAPKPVQRAKAILSSAKVRHYQVEINHCEREWENDRRYQFARESPAWKENQRRPSGQDCEVYVVRTFWTS